jgi:Zn-dependent peptidase ImmA (M78 family)/transcriptional regulator with XRE-family HTH domain
MGGFTPSRLTLARHRRGLTKKALSERPGVNLSIRSLSAYEAGTQEPSELTLIRLAQALDFPVAFFSRPPIDELPLAGASFRALSRMTATKRNQATSAGQLAMELAAWIDERFHLPKPDVPRYRDVNPETAAVAARNDWGLGEGRIPNMVTLLEAHGVRVFSLAEETRDMDAFSCWSDGVPYVFLNTRMKSAEHGRMDAAHELGHLVLHRDHDTPRGRREEHEANLFAGAFLMPEGSIRAYAPRGGGIAELIEAKRLWSVSLAGLAYRMNALGMLSDWEYRSLFIEISARGYRTHEPNSIQRENSQVLAQVFQALREEGISQADVARELAYPPPELHKLIFGLFPTPVEGGRRNDPETMDRGNLRAVD